MLFRSAIVEGKITRIVGGKVIPDTLENQEKLIEDVYNSTKIEKLKANDLIYKLISNYEIKKHDAKDQTIGSFHSHDHTANHGISAKPDTLKPDRLPMQASPLQYKHWKSEFSLFQSYKWQKWRRRTATIIFKKIGRAHV